MTTITPGKITIIMDFDADRRVDLLQGDVSQYAKAITDLVRCVDPNRNLGDDTLSDAMDLLQHFIDPKIKEVANVS